jgi:membrane protein DedA with SNARE-associated domain
MDLLFLENPIIIWLLILWILPWKGVALWKAAKNNDLKWFIAILILNTLAVLEIVYIFFFNKKKPEELKK